MALDRHGWSSLRADISRLLQAESAERSVVEPCLVPISEVEFTMPAKVGDFTDFYTSIHHATNIGRLFRPDNPLLPNFEWIPIGYHGRSSSIEVSGHGFSRPVGQLKSRDSDAPVVAPCRRLDYELELGIFVGAGNALGRPIAIEQAEDHVFGVCLLNDWSARDVQAWEYQPLGPFLAKNFATTISPVDRYTGSVGAVSGSVRTRRGASATTSVSFESEKLGSWRHRHIPGGISRNAEDE